MEIEELFQECVTLVAERVTKEVLNRLAEVEEQKNEPEFISNKQIEQEFYVSRFTVNRRVNEGKLTKMKDKGRVLFLRKEVKALFKKREVARVDTRKYKNKRIVA